MSYLSYPAAEKEGTQRARWGSALAFLWMPLACSLAFRATIGPGIADDNIMFASFIAIPVVCGRAAIRVARSTTPVRILWIVLNVVVALAALAAGVALIWALLHIRV